MYHVATGRLPFEGESVNDIFYQHLNVPPKPILESRPELSLEFANTIMRMLEKLPADRHSSFVELASHFEALYRQALLAEAKSPRRQNGGILARLRKRAKKAALREAAFSGTGAWPGPNAGTRKLTA